MESPVARQFDRLPPHSIESEMCLLGSMMLDVSKDTIGRVAAVLSEDSFFQADHSILFKLLTDLYQKGIPIDAMLVREELIKRQMLDEIGGIEYLLAILSSVPNAASGMHYAGIVKEKAMLRQLIAATNDINRAAYAPQTDARDVLELAEKTIFSIADREIKGDIIAMADSLLDLWDVVEKGGGLPRGIESGFYELDDLLNGLQREEMILVGARPSMGKSAFMTNIVEYVSVQSLKPTLTFSLEMSETMLAARMLCSHSGIDMQRLRKGMCQAHEYAKLSNAVAELSQAPMFCDYTKGLTPMDFRAKSRRMKREHNIELIMLDYIQMMEVPSSKENRQQQISQCSRAIKGVAAEMKLPVVALSQLNRASEETQRRPRMSDLRESGSLEQDADTIMLLHREDYYRMSDQDFTPDNIAEVIIAKQRNGPTDTVKLTWMPKLTRFANLSTQADPF